MSKKKEKPEGILPGTAKSFLGLPYSHSLNTGEKGVVATIRGNELIRQQTDTITRQGNRDHHSSQRAFSELQNLRTATQLGAMELAGTRRELVTANETLSDIDSTLAEELPTIADNISELRHSTNRAAGLPSNPSNLAELVSSGNVDESELIILALGGALKPEDKMKMFESLVPWQRDIIDSGLIYSYDPKMEKTLSPEEKVFLASLRHKAATSLSNYRSIRPLAWHGIFNEEYQLSLSRIHRDARQGTLGVIDATHELADQGATRVSQGNTRIQQGETSLFLQKTQLSQGDRLIQQAQIRISQGEVLNQLQRAGLLLQESSLDEQRGIHRGVNDLVSLEKVAQVDRHAIRKSTEQTADNTADIRATNAIIARGVSAQVHLAQRAEQRLDAIAGFSEGTYRNTGLLTIFAEQANEIAEASLAVECEIAKDTAAMREGMDTLVDLSHQGIELSERTASNTEAIEANTRDLVSFAARADEAHQIMIAQQNLGNRILTDIADGIDTQNYYQALTREDIREVHLTLIQGFSKSTELKAQSLRELITQNTLLSALMEVQGLQHAEVINVLKGIEEGMERRHFSRRRAEAQEIFIEGLANYRKGMIERALKLFNKSLKKWSADFRTYFFRAICHMLMDDPLNAENDFEEAFLFTEEPDVRERAMIKMNLAHLYFSESQARSRKGEVDLSETKLLEAITTAKEAIQEDPEFLDASFSLARYMAAFKLYDDSRIILMQIISKDPSFIPQMQDIPEFEPLIASFPQVFKELEEGDIVTTNVSLIKSCIEMRDFKTAIECIRNILKYSAIDLLRAKPWQISALLPIMDQMIEIVREEMSLLDPTDSQGCYVFALLALGLRRNQNEISDFMIFEVFLKGTENDPDIKVKNKVAMHKKLSELSKSSFKSLLAINKLHRKGLVWLGSE